MEKMNRTVELLTAAAPCLASKPLAILTLADLASAANVPVHVFCEYFPTMHAVGAAVLDHERERMHTAQQQAFEATQDPIKRLKITFRLVGESLESDLVVRAGVRIAAESRDLFPERRLDPFRTWERFITTQLSEARLQGLMHEGIDIASTVRILVAAGMGTKDLMAFHGTWADASKSFESMATSILDLTTRDMTIRIGIGGRRS